MLIKSRILWHLSVQVRSCRNIHVLFVDLLHRSYYLHKTNQTFISSIAVLPSALVMLYHLLDAQLFLQPQLVARQGTQQVFKYFFGLSTYPWYIFFCELGTPELNISSCSGKIIQCQISVTSSQVTNISCTRTDWLAGGQTAGASFIGCPQGCKCT
jgi:hypothetical protein